MQKETRNINENVLSIDTKNQQLIKQNVISIQKHYPNNCYLLLSKNDFGLKKRINVGIFNRKNNFIISEDHSLMFYDKQNDQIKELKLKEALKDYKNKFLIYPVPILFKETTKTLKIKKGKKLIKINLTYQKGKEIGKALMRGKINSKNYWALEWKFTGKQRVISHKKHVLLNAPAEYLVGVLAGMTDNFNKKLIIQNINIYSITLIFNLLGASYSIQDVDKMRKHSKPFYIRFKLPLAFYRDDVNEKAYRNYGYVFENDKLLFKNFNIKEEIFKRFKNLYNLNDYFKLRVNLEHILLIPLTDIKFIKTECKEMYDFITENKEGYSTNYSFVGTPLLKNSDGDILAAVAVWTPEAAHDADEKFGIKNKKNVLSQLTGNVQNWIGNDAILGLYEFTKSLK